MNNIKPKTFLILFCSFFLLLAPSVCLGTTSWIAYFGDQADWTQFLDFDLMVFNSGGTHPKVPPLVANDKKVLGYLSVGEVETEAWYFHILQKDQLIIGQNPEIPGRYLIELRSPRWLGWLMNSVIPTLLQEGFNGLYLDCLNEVLKLERLDPATYAGMRQGLINIIKTIRTQYPDLTILMNSEVDILMDVAGYVDGVLAQGVFSHYDPQAGIYTRSDGSIARRRARELRQVRRTNNQLKIFTLDFWYPDDPVMIRSLYEESIWKDFSPYVGDVYLDQIVPRPAGL